MGISKKSSTEDQTNAALDEALRSSPLVNGNIVSMPSVDEGLGFLFDNDKFPIKRDAIVQIRKVEESCRQNNMDFKLNRAIVFLIPTKSYIPIRDRYAATILKPHKKKRQLSSFNSVMIRHYMPTLKLRSYTSSLGLTYFLVVVGDLGLGGKDIATVNNLRAYYDQAIDAVNDVIQGYKVIPGTHNHRISPITSMYSPDMTKVGLYDLNKRNWLEISSVSMNNHSYADIGFSLPMTQQQLDYFANSHVSVVQGSTYAIYLNTKIQRAYDARCLGDEEGAIILADNYTELVFRFFLFKLLILKGLARNAAIKELESRISMNSLVNELAKQLGFTVVKFKDEILFDAWEKQCRDKRNSLWHSIEGVDVDDRVSLNAVKSSVATVRGLCLILNNQYPELISDTGWLENAAWLADMLK